MNKFKLITLLVGLLLAIAFAVSCSNVDGGSNGSSDDDGSDSGSFGAVVETTIICQFNTGSCIEVSSVESCLELQGEPVQQCSDFFGLNLPACIDEDVIIGKQTWRKCNLDVEPVGTGVAKNSWCNGDEPYARYGVADEYDVADDNCEKFGRLYDWATAMALPEKCNDFHSDNDSDCIINTPHQGLCPEGFHIPTNADWNELFYFVDGILTGDTDLNSYYDSPTAGRKLKTKKGWYHCGSVDSGTYDICEDAYGFSALPGGVYYTHDDDIINTGFTGAWWSSMERYANTAYYHIMNFENEDAYWISDFKNVGLSVRCIKD